MDRRPLQLALRETRRIFTSPRALVIMAAAILVLGLSGPFNTYGSFNTAERLVYWGTVVVLTCGVGQAVAVFLLAALAPQVRAAPVRVVLAALICSVPVTLIVMGVNAIAYGLGPSIDPLQLWLYCAAIALVVVAVMKVFERAAAAEAATAGEAAAAPAIFERVPHGRRGQLIALRVQDHYVEVITEKGRALVLMRLSDAIKETGAIRGLQIHRSHWVALDAVTRVVRSEGKVTLELSNGDRLPVSRGYLPAARAAGLVA